MQHRETSERCNVICAVSCHRACVVSVDVSSQVQVSLYKYVQLLYYVTIPATAWAWDYL